MELTVIEWLAVMKVCFAFANRMKIVRLLWTVATILLQLQITSGKRDKALFCSGECAMHIAYFSHAVAVFHQSTVFSNKQVLDCTEGEGGVGRGKN